MSFHGTTNDLIAELTAGVTDPAALGTLLHRSRSRGLVRIDGDGSRPTAYLKWMNRRLLRTSLRRFFRSGRFIGLLRHEFEMLRAARVVGAPGPEPLAVKDEPGGRSWLLMTEVPGESLRTSTEVAATCSDPATVAARVGRAVAELHRAGFAFHDLKSDHVFVASDVVHFVDWATVERRRSVSRRERIANLAVLGATLPRAAVSDALREAAVRAYAESAPIVGRPDLLVRDVRNATDRLWERRRYRAYYRPKSVRPPRWTQLCDAEGQRDASELGATSDEVVATALRAALRDGLRRAEFANGAFDVRLASRHDVLEERRILDQLRLFDIRGPRAVALMFEGDRGALMIRPAAIDADAKRPVDAAFLRRLREAGLISRRGGTLCVGECRGEPTIVDAGDLSFPQRLALPR